MAAASCAGCAAGTDAETMRTTDHRATRLFIFLAGFFLTNALIGEFVGVKIFALEATLGAEPFNWSLFGINGTLNFTAGVLVWPFVFIMTDIINEYFGVRGVRLISWIAVGFIAYAFLAAYAAISLAPATFWVDINTGMGVPDIQKAYAHPVRPGHVDHLRLHRRVPRRPAHRRRDLPSHPARDRRAIRVAARHRVDGGLATARQLHRAVHRVRHRAAALVDPAVPGDRHGQLRLQDGRGDRADSAAVRGAHRHRAYLGHGEAERLRREAASD